MIKFFGSFFMLAVVAGTLGGEGSPLVPTQFDKSKPFMVSYSPDNGGSYSTNNIETTRALVKTIQVDGRSVTERLESIESYMARMYPPKYVHLSLMESDNLSSNWAATDVIIAIPADKTNSFFRLEIEQR